MPTRTLSLVKESGVEKATDFWQRTPLKVPRTCRDAVCLGLSNLRIVVPLKCSRPALWWGYVVHSEHPFKKENRTKQGTRTPFGQPSFWAWIVTGTPLVDIIHIGKCVHQPFGRGFPIALKQKTSHRSHIRSTATKHLKIPTQRSSFLPSLCC